MINPFQDADWNPDPATRRRFGRSMALGLPIVAAIFSFSIWWKTGRWAAWPVWLGAGGAVAGTWCWLIPQIAGPPYWAWQIFACIMGFVVGNLAMVAIYYLVITPIGLLLRLFGKDPMTRKWNPAARTYWREAEKITDPERYFRQF